MMTFTRSRNLQYLILDVTAVCIVVLYLYFSQQVMETTPHRPKLTTKTNTHTTPVVYAITPLDGTSVELLANHADSGSMLDSNI